MLRKIIEISEEKCNGCGACAAAYNEAAVQRNKEKMSVHSGCPGSRAICINREADDIQEEKVSKSRSCLSQWPVQIKLVPVNAWYYEGLIFSLQQIVQPTPMQVFMKDL